MKTLTEEQVFQHMADNVRAGKSPADRLYVYLSDKGWVKANESVRLSYILCGHYSFALAPRTHTLNGYDVPAPETEAPKVGVGYWVFMAQSDDGVTKCPWNGNKYDQNALRNGIWLSKDDIIANRKALSGENPYA